MRISLAILIGTLCGAGTLQAATTAQISGAAGNDISYPPAQQVKTAEWGFEAPNMFRLDPQEVQSQGATTRAGPRNRLVTPPHGGLVTAVDRYSLPGRE